MARFSMVLVAVWLVAGAAGATTVKTFAFGGLCETAQTVVYVRCEDSQGVVLPDRDGVYTRTRFKVLEVVKGTAGSELELVLPGGAANGQHTDVPGVPQFAVGQETVLFLSQPDENGSPWPVGLGQGCYHIRVDADGTRHVVLTEQSPVPSGVSAKPAQPVKLSLDDFLSRVRSAANAPTERRTTEK